MIQRNQRRVAFGGRVTKGARVCLSDEITPITDDHSEPGFQHWITDIVKKGRSGSVEGRVDGDSGQLLAFWVL